MEEQNKSDTTCRIYKKKIAEMQVSVNSQIINLAIVLSGF